MIPTQILFYDGVCNLCHHAVRFSEKWANTNVHFASLQSDFAKTKVGDKINLTNLNTVIYLKGEKLYTESDAFLMLAVDGKFPFNICSVFLIIPRFIRNPIYRWVAKNRYKWFGKKQQCELPSKTITSRSLG